MTQLFWGDGFLVLTNMLGGWRQGKEVDAARTQLQRPFYTSCRVTSGIPTPKPSAGAKAVPAQQGQAELAGKEKNGKDKEGKAHQKGIKRGPNKDKQQEFVLSRGRLLG